MKETLKLALEAFEDRSSLMKWQMARDAVKEALAQPEQEPTRSQKMRDAGHTRRPKRWGKEQELEPVAWLSKGRKGIWFHEPDASLNAIPLYTTPPQRTWVGLDNDDLIWIYSNSDKVGQAISNTEAKLKQKNT